MESKKHNMITLEGIREIKSKDLIPDIDLYLYKKDKWLQILENKEDKTEFEKQRIIDIKNDILEAKNIKIKLRRG